MTTIVIPEPVLSASAEFFTDQLALAVCNYVSIGQFDLARGCLLSLKETNPLRCRQILSAIADGRSPVSWDSVKVKSAQLRWWAVTLLSDLFGEQVRHLPNNVACYNCVDRLQSPLRPVLEFDVILHAAEGCFRDEAFPSEVSFSSFFKIVSV